MRVKKKDSLARKHARELEADIYKDLVPIFDGYRKSFAKCKAHAQMHLTVAEAELKKIAKANGVKGNSVYSEPSRSSPQWLSWKKYWAWQDLVGGYDSLVHEFTMKPRKKNKPPEFIFDLINLAADVEMNLSALDDIAELQKKAKR